MPHPHQSLIARLDALSDSRMQDHAEEPDGGHAELAAILREAADMLRGGPRTALERARKVQQNLERSLYLVTGARERGLARLAETLHYTPNPAELEDPALLSEAVQKEVERAMRVFAEALPREVILCPKCGLPHVDGASGEAFAHRPHHTHRCEHCTHVWPTTRWSFGIAPPPAPAPVEAVYAYCGPEGETDDEREIRKLWPLLWFNASSVPALRVVGPIPGFTARWEVAGATSLQSHGTTRAVAVEACLCAVRREVRYTYETNLRDMRLTREEIAEKDGHLRRYMLHNLYLHAAGIPAGGAHTMTSLNEAELARLCHPALDQLLKDWTDTGERFSAVSPVSSLSVIGLMSGADHLDYHAERHLKRSKVLTACANALRYLARGHSVGAAQELAALEGITPQAWVEQELALRAASPSWTEEFLRDVAPRLGEENGVGRILRHALHTDRRLDGVNPQVKALRAQYPDTGTERT